ncbi:MAG: hypothetical protein BWK76_27250 [Desulfobulbaceae bacterium A2]|nr:MAG: hypothetical protein BWK76_27250 [Desulfobulbaceae bacterium A2]
MLCRLLAALLPALPCPAPAGVFSGFVEGKGVLQAEDDGSLNDPAGLGWATVLGKWETRPQQTQYTVSLRAEAISGDDQGGELVDLADRGLRRPPFSLREAWLRHPLAPAMDLQLGRFQLGWGKTDGYSPADAFLPRDLTDPFADEKLPLWAVRLSGQRGGWRYDGVLCPLTTPWRLPPLGSRAAPLPDSLAAGTTVVEEDNSPPREGFAALRLLLGVGDWDLGGWLRGGVRPAPLLDFRHDRATAGDHGLVLPVERRYAREQGVGLELSRVVESWIVRAELAALFSRDPDLGDARIGTLSAERSFGDGTLLVTLAGNAVSPPVDAARLFDRAILPACIVAWNRTEEWGSWKLVWTGGLDHGDGLVKAELAYKLTDLWQLTLGGELPYGASDGPLGALHDARRVTLALRRSW